MNHSTSFALFIVVFFILASVNTARSQGTVSTIQTNVVNNTFKKYSQYQYIYFMKKLLAIPIPKNELQKYAILSPILSAILFFVKTVNFKNTTLSRP